MDDMIGLGIFLVAVVVVITARHRKKRLGQEEADLDGRNTDARLDQNQNPNSRTR